MKVIVAGLGIQGRKRKAVAANDVVATVDPIVPDADYKSVEAVPLDRYDTALVCTPDEAKFPILSFLLSNGKHVLVEKPLLEDTNRIRTLHQLAVSSGVACYTAYNHRFEPHIARLRTLLSEGAIGKVYQARLFYGNGTAMDVKRSVWRDKGMGVLPDLGSHLLDMCLFLFGTVDSDFQPWAFNRFENRAFDHFICGSNGSPKIELEMSLVSWRNTFTADIHGELGSLHIHGLCKWGSSVLTIRRRVMPSGRPEEKRYQLESPDPTWGIEYRHFIDACSRAESNLENDVWINSVLKHLEQMVQSAARV